jgi:hypothetical protein
MKPSGRRAAVAMTIVLVYASGISTARATDYDDLIQKGKAEMEGAAAQEGAIATREKMQIVINQYQEAANIFAKPSKRIQSTLWLGFGEGSFITESAK